jgi:phenylacetate-CoA ligase
MFKLIYKLGASKRNPSMQKRFQFLQQSNHWTLAQLQAYQLEELKKFLVFVNDHSPYYKQQFAAVGFDAASFNNFEQLKQIPIIDKTNLIANKNEIHTKYNFGKLFFCETSGSSGQVLEFYRNEVWDSANRAAIMRGLSWHGVNPWDKSGYFWGYNINPKKARKIKLLDFIQNRFRLFSYDEKSIRAFAEKAKSATYLHGYSSMIYEVAMLYNKLGLKNHNVKLLKGTSEKIYDNYHEETKKAFGKKIVSEYGAAESGILAFECEQGHMHLHMEGAYIEVENDEILVTNFLSYSFPIIRYKLGDYIKLAAPDFKCSCGREHPVVLEVLGRIGKRIYGKQGFFPSLTLYYIFKNLALNKGINLNYKAIQKTKGELDFLIEQDSPQYQADVMEECVKYFGSDLDIHFFFGANIHDKTKKLKDFESFID